MTGRPRRACQRSRPLRFAASGAAALAAGSLSPSPLAGLDGRQTTRPATGTPLAVGLHPWLGCLVGPGRRS